MLFCFVYFVDFPLKLTKENNLLSKKTFIDNNRNKYKTRKRKKGNTEDKENSPKYIAFKN